jgi:hypothetical protein
VDLELNFGESGRYDNFDFDSFLSDPNMDHGRDALFSNAAFAFKPDFGETLNAQNPEVHSKIPTRTTQSYRMVPSETSTALEAPVTYVQPQTNNPWQSLQRQSLPGMIEEERRRVAGQRGTKRAISLASEEHHSHSAQEDIQQNGVPPEQTPHFYRPGLAQRMYPLRWPMQPPPAQQHYQKQVLNYAQASPSMSMLNRPMIPPHQAAGQTKPPYENATQPRNHALEDYHMQLALLEQQNKKRLLLARQEHADSLVLNAGGVFVASDQLSSPQPPAAVSMASARGHPDEALSTEDEQRALAASDPHQPLTDESRLAMMPAGIDSEGKQELLKVPEHNFRLIIRGAQMEAGVAYPKADPQELASNSSSTLGSADSSSLPWQPYNPRSSQIPPKNAPELTTEVNPTSSYSALRPELQRVSYCYIEGGKDSKQDDMNEVLSRPNIYQQSLGYNSNSRYASPVPTSMPRTDELFPTLSQPVLDFDAEETSPPEVSIDFAPPSRQVSPGPPKTKRRRFSASSSTLESDKRRMEGLIVSKRAVRKKKKPKGGEHVSLAGDRDIVDVLLEQWTVTA